MPSWQFHLIKLVFRLRRTLNPPTGVLDVEKERVETEALAAYDRAMIETGIYRDRQVSVPGIEGESEDYGCLEHSARRVSRPARTTLSQVLRDQGFGLQ